MPEDLLQAPPSPAPGAKARPGDVPEKFWDGEAGALRVDALLKSYRELERRLSQRAAPPAQDATPEDLLRFRQSMGIPETPETYDIKEPHELCCADKEVNRRLHAANFSNDQAQLVYDLAAERLVPLIAEAAVHFEADRQRERLAAHFGGDERFRQVAAQLSAWGRTKLPGPVYEALASTSEGVLALEQMMRKDEPALSRDSGPPASEGESELRAMMRDPRYWRQREPEFVRRVTEGFRRLVNNSG